jgi:hypothetical protein
MVTVPYVSRPGLAGLYGVTKIVKPGSLDLRITHPARSGSFASNFRLPLKRTIATILKVGTYRDKPILARSQIGNGHYLQV